MVSSDCVTPSSAVEENDASRADREDDTDARDDDDRLDAGRTENAGDDTDGCGSICNTAVVSKLAAGEPAMVGAGGDTERPDAMDKDGDVADDSPKDDGGNPGSRCDCNCLPGL